MKIEYRILFWILLAAFFVTYLSLFVTSGMYVLQHNPRAIDFLAFFTGAQLPSNELYNLHAQALLQHQIDPLIKNTVFLPFINPPFVALIFHLVGYFGVGNAYIIFLTINSLLLVAICIIASKQFAKSQWYYLLLFIVYLITFTPVLVTLIIGQLSILLCIFFLLAWLFLKKRREFLSGLLFSLILIKPHFLLLPFFAVFLQRRKRVIYGFFTGIAILVGVSYLYVGVDGLRNYLVLLGNLYKTGSGYNLDLLDQYSLQTFFLFIFHTQSLDAIRTIWFLAVVCISIPTLYLWTRKISPTSSQFSFQFALLIIATLLISPHTPIYDLSLLSIVSYLILPQVYKLKNKPKILLLALIVIGYIVLLIGYQFDIVFQGQSQNVWISITVLYLIIYWMVILRILLIPQYFTKLHKSS